MEGRASTQDLTSTSVPALRATQVPTAKEVSVRDLQHDSFLCLQLHTVFFLPFATVSEQLNPL